MSGPGRPTRRALLAAVAAGAVAGLTGCRQGPASAGSRSARIVEGEFDSVLRRTLVGWAVAVPRGMSASSLPVTVYLHGLHGDHRSAFDYHALHTDLQAWVDGGGAPFVIATVDGGDNWWKPQPDGTDAGAMVIEEFLPLLRRRGLDVDRLALSGASMGGYGALRLVGTGAVTPRCVGVVAPALGAPIGRSGTLTDVSRHPGLLTGTPVLLEVGEDDAFLDVDLAYVAGLRRAGVTVTSATYPGGHNPQSMRASGPDLVRFDGEHLAAGGPHEVGDPGYPRD